MKLSFVRPIWVLSKDESGLSERCHFLLRPKSWRGGGVVSLIQIHLLRPASASYKQKNPEIPKIGEK